MHVWPSRQLDSLIEGFWHGPILGPATRVPMTNAPVLLDAKRQGELISGQQVASVFGMPGARLVVHDEPLGRAQSMAATPAVAPAPPCLAEIAIAKSFLEKGALSGPSVRVFGYVRVWNEGKLAWRWSGFGAADLAVDVPKTEAETTAAIPRFENSWKNAVSALLVSASTTHH